jgi:hypothetical protein
MWGEGGLASEFDAFGFRIGPAPCRALGDAAAFKFRGNAKHGKDKFAEIARGIKHRIGNRPQARPGPLHVTGDDKKVGRIARQAVNCRDYHNVAVGLLEFDRLCWGRLGRPCDRPLLDLFLFTQKIVYFGL